MIDIEFVSESGMGQEPTFDIYKRDIQDGSVLCVFEVPKPDPHLKLKRSSKIGLHFVLTHTPVEGIQLSMQTGPNIGLS